jgi:N-methylhydantoinase A
VRWDGSIEKPLDEKAARDVIRQLKREGISSVVVCFINAHRNPAHELRLRDLIKEEDWSPYLSLSHEILGREGEYDRLSTSTVNSYVGPGLGRYLGNLVQRLSDEGLSVPVMVMQSTGGALPVNQAVLHAVGAITSGPAGGAMAGAWFSRVHGDKQFVTYDMGGTSTDICLIQNGTPLERQQTDFRDVKVAVSALDIAALGAGGGSIAKIDQGGILDLGPESAGAQPGPACYGRGGELPTLTDANVVLGYISSDTFLGGRMSLSRDAAVAAITKYVAEPLSLSVEDASLAINALASTRIAEGIRASTVRRGIDPRDVSLFSFGGAGGLHADMVARELMIPKALIPREASVLSALGFLSSDVRHDFAAPVAKTISTLKPGDMKKIFEPLERQGRELLRKEGFADSEILTVRLLDCRY